MADPLLELDFDAVSSGDPSGWSDSGNKWAVGTAPAGLSGKTYQASQVASDNFAISPTFTRTTSGYKAFRFKTKTGPNNSTRWGYFLGYDGSNFVWQVIFTSDGNCYFTGTGSTILFAYAVDTVYDVVVEHDQSGKKARLWVNGTLYDNGGSWFDCQNASGGLYVDRLRLNCYSPSGSGTIHYDDLIVVGEQAGAAVGAYTLYGAGTHQSVVCGTDLYARAVLVAEYGGSGGQAASFTVERSADGGTTWAAVTTQCDVTSLGSGHFKIIDRAPVYGSQAAAAFGSTVKYRVVPRSGVYKASTTSSVDVTPQVDKTAVELALAAQVSSYMANTYIPSESAGEPYAGYPMLAMAYAYWLTVRQGSPVAQYKTDCLNQFNHIVSSMTNADGLIKLTAFTSYVYRDHHWRTVLHAAIAGIYLGGAGATSDAQTIIDQCDVWAKGGIDKLARSTVSVAGWDPSNVDGQTAAWQASHAYSLGDIVKPTVANGHTYRCIAAGTSHSSAPTWPTGSGGTVTETGGVQWKETSSSGAVFASIYDPTSPYAAAASYDVDTNQVLESAAALALLLTDTRSDFSVAGSYRTSATTIATDALNLMRSYQVSLGKVPVGDPIPPLDARNTFDTLYGGYSTELLGIAYQRLGDVNGEVAMILAQAVEWLQRDYSSLSGGLGYVHFGGDTDIQSNEVANRLAGAGLAQNPDPIDGLLHSAAFFDPATGKQTLYTAAGGGSARDNRLQARWFDGVATQHVVFQLIDAGLASETDSAFGLTIQTTTPVGVGDETDSGLAVAASGPQSQSVGLATETDTGLAVTPDGSLGVLVEMATETDTGLDVVPSVPQSVAVDIAAETDTGLAVIVPGVFAMNMRMPPGTVVGVYRRHEWIGSEVPVRGAGSYPGPAVQEATVDDYGEVEFLLSPGSYIAWAEDFPLRRRFFVVTDD